MKFFHDLSSEEQNELRKKYKSECEKEYKFSIHLYVIYVILGFLAVGGLISCFINAIIGLVIFSIGFIMMIVVIHLLNKSNNSFYDFLKKEGYEYDSKLVEKIKKEDKLNSSKGE